ncbi:MAG TPA: DUF1573 domain-containing protein [Puia sp.]|nr:DUF1573 domain-containing protein [Puia sp.]
MKLTLTTLAVALGVLGCQHQEKQAVSAVAALRDSANFTTIEWLDSTSRDFGRISEGQKLEVSFRFRNSGEKPLVIASVRPSCGCTVAEQPAEAIVPGKVGVIRAVFDSEKHVGTNHKSLLVLANTKGTTTNELQFAVIVEKKKW